MATACAAGPGGGAAGAAADASARLAALVGDAACSADAQCATVAVGQKACGGPERYVAWSRQRSEATSIEAAAKATRERPAPFPKDALSTCSVVTDPGATCAPADPRGGAGRACRLRDAGGAGSGIR